MPRSQHDAPTVTRSKSPKHPAEGDPSPAREGQQPAPKAREGVGAADRPPTRESEESVESTDEPAGTAPLDRPVTGKLSGRTPAREAEPGRGRPADPQVPRAREVIAEDRTPETDTDRGPRPEEEGRTAR